MKVLIVAPHQDDEILGAGGLIQQYIRTGNTVKILFVTNGDYHGPENAKLRYYESCAALSHLGLSENNLFYMGYGDTGMRASHSFLRKLYISDIDKPLSTPFSNTTYHPAEKKTIHFLRAGVESIYTKREFLVDLSWFINNTEPDLIIIPHPSDMHGDHAAVYKFLKCIYGSSCLPVCISYIIHGGDDSIWPNRNSLKFVRPPVISSVNWNKHISIQLSPRQQMLKYDAICMFETQMRSGDSKFMLSFSKQEEIFFLLGTKNFNQQDIYNHLGYKEKV